MTLPSAVPDIMLFFWKFISGHKMAAAAILDFQFMWIWPFRSVDSVVFVFCTKCGSNICYSYWDWRTYASDIHLMTSRELTSGFDFWSRGHLRVAVMHRSDPQKALPWTERRVLSPHWSRSDVQCDLWPWQRNQKKEKKDTPDSGKLAIRPDHPRRRIEGKVCMPGGLRCLVLYLKCY